jgi:hypothetical protein
MLQIWLDFPPNFHFPCLSPRTTDITAGKLYASLFVMQVNKFIFVGKEIKKIMVFDPKKCLVVNNNGRIR